MHTAIDGLVPDLRKYALVDFNLDADQHGETLTVRQEKLAEKQRQVAKTVRRHAAKALDALAVALVSGATHPNFAETGRSFVQAEPTVDIRELQPSQYGRRSVNPLLVLGGPSFDRMFKQYQSQLQVFTFEERPPGEDDFLVVKALANRRFGPRWTGSNELLTDVSVFVRLTFAADSKVFLAAGCLTLGVHGAARCFLHGAEGARNVRHIAELAGERDFVLVAEVGHDGPGRTPVVPDFTKTAPMLLIARDAGGGFGDILVDNTEGKDYQEA